MDVLIQALAATLSLQVMGSILLGTAIGIIIGALPGLTSTMGMALAVPLTFGQEPLVAFAMMLGLYVGSVYGGSISAILLNTPGTPAASATLLDGYPLAQKGKGGLAIGMATISSSIGGLISVVLLILVAPQLARFGLKFSAPEYFGLALFGLTVIIGVSSGSILKGLISGTIGFLLAMVGTDEISGYFRFTYQRIELFEGISFIPLMIGLFAMSEIFATINEKESDSKVSASVSAALPSWNLIRSCGKTIMRSSLIGTFTGVIPGAGAAIASFISYNEAKRASKEPETFGKGNPEGVAATESANNAVVGGAMVPLLTLAIPGDSVTAILLGAFLIHGLRPGPLLFVDHRDIVIALFVIMIIANVALLLLGLVGAKVFSRILLIPKSIMHPVIVTLAIVGSYAINNSMFHVYIMLFAGVLGFILRSFKFPLVPVVLGLILGPMAEVNFRRALVMSKGHYNIFFTQPISAVLLALTAVFLVISVVRERKSAHLFREESPDAS